MLDKTKCDPILGQQIHERLVSLGLETPMIKNNLTEKQKIQKLEKYFLEIMKTLELDYTNDSMMGTPKRLAKLYVNEVMYGLNYNNFPKIMDFENTFHDAGMVVEKNIGLNSLCSHHFVPTIGKVTIGYIPGKKTLGLSKLNRCVDFFARRPQEQERLIMQIWHALAFILETEDVAIHIDAKHLCVSWRGAGDPDASFVTAKLGGSFKDDPCTRKEFYDIINLSYH